MLARKFTAVGATRADSRFLLRLCWQATDNTRFVNQAIVIYQYLSWLDLHGFSALSSEFLIIAEKLFQERRNRIAELSVRVKVSSRVAQLRKMGWAI
jgi:hypothetical protein